MSQKESKPINACILWTKAVSSSGYGSVLWDGRVQQAHRAEWEKKFGKIPKGLHVLHKCDVKLCVNTDHLFLGTHRDNMRDMALKGRAKSPNSQKTHCPKGHQYTEENTYKDSKGWRKCKICTLKRLRDKYARNS